MHFINRNGLAIIAIAAGFCFATARTASATNLLANGTFTSTVASPGTAGPGLPGNVVPSGWTVSGATTGVGNDWFFGVHAAGGPTPDLFAGQPAGENVMEAFHTTTPGSIAQTFSGMSVGTTYVLEFEYNSGDTMPSLFSIALTGANNFIPTLPTGSAPLTASGWVPDFFLFTATATSGTLTFGMQDTNSNVEIGDVFIGIPGTQPTIPLPPTFYMSIPAAVGAGWYFLRRKMAASALPA